MTPELAGHDPARRVAEHPFAMQTPGDITAFLDRAVRMRDPPVAVPRAVDMQAPGGRTGTARRRHDGKRRRRAPHAPAPDVAPRAGTQKRAVSLSPIPCSGGVLSFALSRRRASSDSSRDPGPEPVRVSRQPRLVSRPASERPSPISGVIVNGGVKMYRRGGVKMYCGLGGSLSP